MAYRFVILAVVLLLNGFFADRGSGAGFGAQEPVTRAWPTRDKWVRRPRSICWPIRRACCR